MRPSPNPGTLALRIQFNGWDGQKVSRTSQDDIQLLVPWLRATLTSLRLPHPKPANVIKPNNATSVIEMFWDAENIDPITKNVVIHCNKMDGLTLQEMSIDHLMVFMLPMETREIPSWKTPYMTVLCPYNNSTTIGPSHSRPASTELEEALLKTFESIGLSIPTPVENLAAYIPALSQYHEMLRGAVNLEAAARRKAEAALAEERARHARILQDIQMECREPFVVPALLDAFVAVSQVVDGISVPQAG